MQLTAEEKLYIEEYSNVLLTVFQAELKARKLNIKVQYYATNWFKGIKKWFNEEKLVWKIKKARREAETS